MPRTRLHQLLLLAGGTAAALGAAPAAHAATFSRATDGAIEYVAAPGEKNRVLIYDNDDHATMTLYDPTGTSAGTTPSGCQGFAGPDTWSITCAYAPVRVHLGDSDDSATVSHTVPGPIVFDGGDGNDQLEGNEFADTLIGGPGNDTLDGNEGDDTLDGGDGNDTVEGSAGRDRVSGGAGDDLVSGDGSEGQWTDVVDGGPGTDRIEIDFQDRFASVAAQPPITLSLAGGADDGRPGEGDDVRGVERVLLNIPGTYSGTDGPDQIEVHQVLASTTLSGGGGDDILVGPDGADHLDGGAGNDTLDAGYGDDTVVGGPGRDVIRADRTTQDCGFLWCKYPYGNDTVDAVDGEIDSVSCGAGTDVVRADPQDVVAPDCETVTRVGGGAAGAGGSANGGPGTGGGAGGSPTPTVRGRTGLGGALRSGFKVRVTGATPGSRLTFTARAGRRAVARGSAKVSGAGNATVTLRFSAAGRRWAAHRRAAALTVSGGGLRLAVTLRR